MIAACAVHVPIRSLPARVSVIRGGRRVTGPGLYLQVGDRIRTAGPSSLAFSYDGNRFRVSQGESSLQCRRVLVSGHSTSALAVRIEVGRVQVRAGRRALRALVLSHEMLADAIVPGTHFVVDRDPRARSTSAWTLDRTISAAQASDQRLRVDAQITYTAISDHQGLRLDVWPFAISPLQRSTTRADGLVPYWSDGLACSVGCAAPGAIPGWPLKPFHQQHAIRAGINELRPANFHVAVDIEARDFQPVYAIQSGYASIRYAGSGDVNVDIGSFYYWHINPTVRDGQYVVAYKTMIGQVLKGFYHLALSEGNTNDYLNPLRPGGSLRPYTDTERPVIGIPRIFSDGRVIVGAFDPQSFVATGFSYETPVLAVSSLAWRLYDARGRPLTGLEWAMRGSQNYPPGLLPVVYAPGAANPGFNCFFTRRRCVPNWVYWLAGGLTPPLPLSGLPSGRYRLTVYAWDWAGNTSALDYTFRWPTAAADRAGSEFGPLAPQFDYSETGAPIPPPG